MKGGETNANVFILAAWRRRLDDGGRVKPRGMQTVCLRNKPIYFFAVSFFFSSLTDSPRESKFLALPTWAIPIFQRRKGEGLLPLLTHVPSFCVTSSPYCPLVSFDFGVVSHRSSGTPWIPLSPPFNPYRNLQIETDDSKLYFWISLDNVLVNCTSFLLFCQTNYRNVVMSVESFILRSDGSTE